MKKRILFTFSLLAIIFDSSAQIPPHQSIIYDSTGTTGYYFLVPSRLTTPNAGFHSQLVLDRFGDVVYFKSLGSLTNTPDFKVQPNGMITYFRNNMFYILDSTFTIVDSVGTKNGITTDSHDFQILPNGHFLFLGYKNVIMNLSAYAWFKPSGTHGSSSATVKYNVIQELDANKNVVFEWHAKDYFAFTDVDSTWLSNPVNVDWTHANAVELDNDGNILLSCRHFNQIIKINRTDSSIIWRMGGVGNQFTFLNDTTPFYGQHDIRRIANGNVTFLDNGYRLLSAPYHAARAVEYQLDEVNYTASLVWKYQYDTVMYSKATGNVQRLPNGNTLVNYGQFSRNNVTFVVVDPLGNKTFELFFYDSMSSYRSFNFQQLPWMFNRPQVTCIDSAGGHYLDAGPGYASYVWNNGDTNRIIPVSAADTFLVFVPYGNGGYISSEKFIVTNAADPCGLGTSVSSINMDDELLIYPNPVEDKLEIRIPNSVRSNSKKPIEILIYNQLGKEVLSVADSRLSTVDCRLLSSGLYYIRITTAEKTISGKFVKN
ncbi:MAG: aryl-sulfate sulfotransferase [Bacteroidetes bacterium]|nr:aryl-sulfate sulfotransferase [Bacteroidota bacterium]